jgi:hypothetical protein
MKKGLFASLVLLFTGLSLAGQSGFRPGYVIKADHDTLNGLVYYGAEKGFEKECRFKRFDIAREVVYAPDQLIGYGFRNSRYFEAKKKGLNARFLECLLKGTISVYIHPGDFKGGVYVESPETGFFQLKQAHNKISGAGEPGDYRAVLNWLADKSGEASQQVNQVKFEATAIVAFLRNAGSGAGYPEQAYARSDRVHVLGDNSLLPASSRLTLGIAGGYQFLMMGIEGTNVTPFFRAADFNFSYRPAAGLFLNRQFSKRSDRASAEIGLQYLQDTYYAYAEYTYESDQRRDDIFVEFQALQLPVSLKFMLGTGKNRPYIRIGAYKTFLLSSSYERISERDNESEIYLNSYHNYVYHNAFGLTGGMGLEFRMGNVRKISLEAGYMKDFQNLKLPGAKDIYNGDITSNGLSLMARISL